MSRSTQLEETDLPKSAPGTWSSRLTSGVVALAFLIFAGRMFRLISRYAVNIFFSDQWSFNNATLFQKHSIWQMFTWQHGPHRQGLGALFEKLIEPSFRWNSRIESFVVGGAVVVAALCALYLKKRLYGHFSASDVLIPAIFFIPRQFETLFVTANFAHGPFPLLLIVLYCLAWTCSRPVLRYALVLVINFLTIYTGFGLLLGFITPILILLDHRTNPPESRLRGPYLIFAVALSLVSLGSFFINYEFTTGLGWSPLTTPKNYIAYMAYMFANFFALKPTHAVQNSMAGLAILIVLLASLLVCVWQLLQIRNINLTNIRLKRSLIVTSLIAFCLLFCLMTAVGRLRTGLLTTYASRYVIYLNLGFLGLYFHLLNISRPVMRRLFLAALLTSVLASSWHINRMEMGHFPLIKQQWQRCYLQVENIDRCNAEAGSSIYPPAVMALTPEARQAFQGKLQYLKKNRLNLYSDSVK